jgi:hypothetical protein
MSGIGVNFDVCGFKIFISAVSSARVGTDSPTAAAVPSIMSSAPIRFDRMVISVLLPSPTPALPRERRIIISAAPARVCPRNRTHELRRETAFSAPSNAAR